MKIKKNIKTLIIISALHKNISIFMSKQYFLYYKENDDLYYWSNLNHLRNEIKFYSYCSESYVSGCKIIKYNVNKNKEYKFLISLFKAIKSMN